jgi:hypothetical protein
VDLILGSSKVRPRWRRNISKIVEEVVGLVKYSLEFGAKGELALPARQLGEVSAHDRARSLKPGGRDRVEERPRLVASEIEEELFAELQKLPTLRDTRSVTIRPYSGPKSWTWELDRIEPEVGPEQSKFADVMGVVARLQQQYDLDLSPPPPA